MTSNELTGWKRIVNLKLRFGLSKLPVFPARYRLRTSGRTDHWFWWTRVIPFMDPAKGAFDYELYGWDVRELRFLVRFLQPGMTFLDVGAHHGLYALLAAQLIGPTGRIIAFEPSPDIVRRLRWHVRLNGHHAIEILPRAVGAREGHATLFIPTAGIDTISSLRPPGVGNAPTRRAEIEMVTLDGVVNDRDLKQLDLVKLDVEGAESEVLDGAGAVLGTFRPLWIFEALDSTSGAWGGSGRALVNRFLDLGHEIFEFTEDGWLRRHHPREIYPLDSNCNLLAVPRGKTSALAACFAPGTATDG